MNGISIMLAGASENVGKDAMMNRVYFFAKGADCWQIGFSSFSVVAHRD
jgi:hypothetical protein